MREVGPKNLQEHEVAKIKRVRDLAQPAQRPAFQRSCQPPIVSQNRGAKERDQGEVFQGVADRLTEERIDIVKNERRGQNDQSYQTNPSRSNWPRQIWLQRGITPQGQDAAPHDRIKASVGPHSRAVITGAKM